jgi:hypothetical protein
LAETIKDLKARVLELEKICFIQHENVGNNIDDTNPNPVRDKITKIDERLQKVETYVNSKWF